MNKMVRFVTALIPLIANWRQKAIEAVKTNAGRLYVPCSMTFAEFRQALAGAVEMGGGKGGESSYLSLEEGIRGRNSDGSRHGGFLIIDVIDRIAVDLVDEKGQPKFHNFGEMPTHGESMADWIGFFVILEADGWPYVDPRCRCPQIQFNVFASRELADKKVEHYGGGVHQITPEFAALFMERY